MATPMQIGVDPTPTGYVPSKAGILVPADMMVKSLRAEQEINKARNKALREVARGAFFSDWTRLTGFNQAGAMEKPSDEVNFSFLRDTYEHSAIDQIIINTRIQQIRQVSQRCRDPKKHAGFRVVHKNHDQDDFVETDELRKLCEHIEDIIGNPWDHVHPNGVKDVFTISVREELTIDRKVAIVVRDRMKRPVKYWLIDGATVLPVIRVLYPWLMQNAQELGIQFDPTNPDSLKEALNRAGEEISNITGIAMDKLAYVQEVDSKIMAGWTKEQLAIDITQPSVWVNKLPFGQGSLLQQSIELTAAWVNGWQYNQSLFRTNYPERLVAIKGDYDPNALEAMKRKIFSEAGPASWERLLLMPGDEDFEVQTFNLRDTPKDMLYGELLRIIINLKTAVYRMDPSTIGFSHDAGGGASLFSTGDREQQLSMAQEEGFHGLLQNLANWFTETIVKPWHEDLIMIFDGLKQEQEQERIELSSKAVEAYWTIDEARAIENKPPLPNGMGKLPLPLQQLKMQSDKQAQMNPMGASPQGNTKANPQGENLPKPPNEKPKVVENLKQVNKSMRKSLLIEVVD